VAIHLFRIARAAQGEDVPVGVAVDRLVAGAVAFGCTSGPTAPSGASAACDPQSTSANAVLPIFGRPFDGAFPIGNFFDHEQAEAAAHGPSDAGGCLMVSCAGRGRQC
jgi:hypothetical protein